MLRHTLFACLSVVIAGCGVAEPADDQPDAQAQLPGSYTLAFASVTATKVTQPGTTARLDLQDDAGSLKAVLTVDWSPPSPCAVELSGGQMQLKCTAEVRPSSVNPYDLERWSSVVIPLSAQGGLGQSFSATGVHVPCGDDYCSQHVSTTGQGSVATDTRNPEGTASIGGSDGPVLPWSTLSLRFSEPVEPQAVIARLQVSTAGATVPVAWQPEFVSRGSYHLDLPLNDEASTVWAGRVFFLGRLSTWDGVSGSTLGLATTTGIMDRAGNEAAPVSLSKQVLDLKTPASSFDFDAAIPAGSWGTATIADAAQCESGGCLKLGPTVTCGTSTGVAGLLPDVARSKMRVRYRIGFSAKSWGSAASEIALQVASPGLDPVTVQIPQVSYHEVDAGPEGMDRLSDWTTAEVELPPGVQAGQAGIALGFARSCTQWGEHEGTVWIESIVFE